MKLYRHFFALGIAMGVAHFSYSQLVVNNVGITANILTNNISGNGVVITNPILDCPTGASGTFTSNATNLGLNAGILLTSGDAQVAVGPNTGTGAGAMHNTSYTDADLTAIEPAATNDVCRLEFDILPQCDTLRLNYVFASEEYPDYVNGGVNDAFGFFVSGPNPLGGNYTNVNIALVPGTATPIAINNVNNGNYFCPGPATGPCMNCAYYIDNCTGATIQYDGFTTMLTAEIPVVQCASYHMKLIIADAGDWAFDSGVFLDFEGLQCPNNDVSVVVIDSMATEGCDDAEIQINRTDVTGNQTVTITGGGSATMGTDYTINGTYTMTPGQGSMNIIIPAIADAIAEGQENAWIYVSWDVCGLAVTDSVQIFINDPPDVTFTIVDENCGACDGSAQANITGGAAPFTYQWDAAAGSQTTQTATALCTGSYTVTVTDANGCVSTGTATVNSIGGPTLSAPWTDETCAGDNDGTITASAVGGNAPYTYDITGPVTQTNGTGSFTNLPPGVYTVTVTDNNGCTSVLNVTIAAGPVCCPMTLTTSFTDVVCNGACDGTATVTAANNVGAPSYNWLDAAMNPIGQTTATATGLCPGTYTVDVTDNNCTVSATVTISEPTALGYTPSITDLTCNGDNSGAIDIPAAGGTPPYQYSINGGPLGGTSNFTGLAAGNYTMLVEDANGCQYTTVETVNEPPALTFTFSTFDVSCFGLCDGSAIAIPAGGTLPYTYNWTNAIAGPNDAQANNVCAGTYTLTITDANGCFVDTTFTITEPPALVINNIIAIDETCANACDGEIHVDSPDGVLFGINGGPMGVDSFFLNQCPGTYLITVENANGCQITQNVTVSGPQPIVVTTSPDVTICVGASTTIDASSTGGVAPITFIWDNGLPTGNSHSVSPAVNTVYNVYAQDANGCVSATMPIVVSIAQPLSVIALSDQTLCEGQSAQLSAIAQGGDGNYTYSWDDGMGGTFNGQSITVTPNGTTTYTVLVTDGCNTPAANATATITIAPTPVVTFTADSVVGCAPFTVNFTNTTPPGMIGSTVIWDFGDGNIATDITNTSHTYNLAGTYDVSLSVTSPDGCVGDTTISQMITIYGEPVPAFIFTPDDATIFNPNIWFWNGSIGADSYFWDFGGLGTSTDANPSFEFPDSIIGTYPVCLTATNAIGCSQTVCQDVFINGEFWIYVPNAFTPDNDGLNDIFFAQGRGFDNNDFKLFIFNKWGEKIFEADNPSTYWDGTYKGEMVKQDVYVWRILCKDNYTNEKKEFRGHVTLLR